MIDSFVSAAASIAILPQLLSAPPPFPGVLVHAGQVHVHEALLADLIIAPSGHVQDCKIDSSSLALPSAEAKFCNQLSASEFSPAINAQGDRVYGKFQINFGWTELGELTEPLPIDVDLTVEHLPPGSPIHPRTQLALTVDPQGHVLGCEVAKSSGFQAFDEVACKAGVETASIQPLKDETRNPTTSIQSLVVGFGVYTALIAKKDTYYASLGVAGPYFPDRGLRNNMSGYAVLVCIPNQSGELTNCSVDEETPLSFGFGDAALKMAKEHWIRVAPDNPKQVLIIIDFVPPKGNFPY